MSRVMVIRREPRWMSTLCNPTRGRLFFQRVDAPPRFRVLVEHEVHNVVWRSWKEGKNSIVEKLEKRLVVIEISGSS
jgi:hypothetical protein